MTPLGAIAWGLLTFAVVAAGCTLALRENAPRTPVVTREVKATLYAALDRECPGMGDVDWPDRGE